MEKVKITQEQADAIKEMLKTSDKPRMVRATCMNNWSGDYPLHKMELETVIKALYIGYEIEPKFKEGDWVVVEGEEFYMGSRHSQKITTIDKERHFLEDGYWSYKSQIRHATSKEIFWAENDRDVWEIREGDILNVNDEYLEVERIEGNTITFSTFDDWIELDEMKHNIDVVCFAKDRKDIGGI